MRTSSPSKTQRQGRARGTWPSLRTEKPGVVTSGVYPRVERHGGWADFGSTRRMLTALMLGFSGSRGGSDARGARLPIWKTADLFSSSG